MSSKKLTVVVTRRLPDPVEARLSELFDAKLNQHDKPFSRDDLIEALKTADVLVPTLNDVIDADMLAQAGPQLRLIANYGSGFDHIDVKAAHKHKITVSNSPSMLSSDTADMAMALLLAVARRFKEGATVMSSGEWSGWAPSSFLGHSVSGKKLGILGMGRVGSEVARRAAAFGMEIHYHNRNPVHPEIEETLGATYWKSLKLMLSEVDFLSVNCPHNRETHHILNAQTLGLMRETAVIVNTARGGIIDEAALVELIKSRRLAGAGLDVLEHGDDINPILRDAPNVMLLPHMASATVEARRAMGETVIYNIKMVEDGHRAPNVILPDMA